MAVDVEQVILDLSITGDMADELRAQESAAKAHGLAVDSVTTSLKRAKDGTYALVASLKTYNPAQRAAKAAAQAAAKEARRLATEQRRAARDTASATAATRDHAQGLQRLGMAMGRVYIRTRTLILSFIGLKSMAVLIRNVLRTLQAGMAEYLTRNDEAQRSVYGLRDSLKDLNGAVGEAILGGGNAEVMFGALNRAIEGVTQIVVGSTQETQAFARVLSADIVSAAVFVAQMMLRFAQAVNVVRQTWALVKFAIESTVATILIAIEGLKMGWGAMVTSVRWGAMKLMEALATMGEMAGQDMSEMRRSISMLGDDIARFNREVDGSEGRIEVYRNQIRNGARDMATYIDAVAQSTAAIDGQIESFGALGEEIRSGMFSGLAAEWQRFGVAASEAGDSTEEAGSRILGVLQQTWRAAHLAGAAMQTMTVASGILADQGRKRLEAELAVKQRNAQFMNAERDHMLALIKYEQDLLQLKRDGWEAALSEAKSFTKEYGALQAGLLLIEAFIMARKAAMNLATPGMQGFGIAQGIAAADAIREAYRLGAKGGGGGGTRSGPAQQSPQNIANIYVTQNNSGIGVNGGDMARSLAPIMQSAFDNHHVVVRS